MYKICCIVDFDGFTFRSYTNGVAFKDEFLIREIGYVRVDPEFGDFLAKSYRFDLSFYDFRHCMEAWNTINHQTRYVTGLPFRPQKGERVYKYELVHHCVKAMYATCRQPDRDVVAFKGGCREKIVLEELGIPSLDLGQCGCPRYEQLVAKNMVSSQLIDCGYHQRLEKAGKPVHCPRAEVVAFKDWLLMNYPHGYRGGTPELDDPCRSTAGSSLPLSSADSSSDVASTSDCN